MTPPAVPFDGRSHHWLAAYAAESVVATILMVKTVRYHNILRILQKRICMVGWRLDQDAGDIHGVLTFLGSQGRARYAIPYLGQALS